MVRTPSTMLELGTALPPFSLLDTVSGKTVNHSDFSDAQGLLVLFICNHCPFVIHIRQELAALGREYYEKGIKTVAISSNDVENYPDDSPEKMTIEASAAGYSFPYLYDETQDVAKAFRAACTPDIFLFDKDLKLAYRGQIDGSRPGNDIPVTGEDIRAALDAVAGNGAVSTDQIPSLGCNIKWKSGGEPEYFGA